MIASDALRYQIKTHGRTLRIRYYTESIGSVWDDERVLTLSGTDLYISGLVQEIDRRPNSRDSVLIEQGRLGINDKKFFIAGSIQTTSGNRIFTITISGANSVYREITPGISIPQIGADDIYKVVYGRLVTTGSLT